MNLNKNLILRFFDGGMGKLTLNFLKRRFCCRFLIDGFVSNECGLFFFLADAIAALNILGNTKKLLKTG